MDVWVARQPIFDRKRGLYAYELLFRNGGASREFDGADAAGATMQVIANCLLGIGIDSLLNGKKAFLNFDRALLTSKLHAVLPKDRVVVEILESVDADEEVLDACRKLRAAGFILALDDFEPRPAVEPLIPFAHIIKVDLRATTRHQQRRMLAAYQPRGIEMLAEKVETVEEFQWAWNAGYDYFQGYFFARPAIVQGRQVPAVKATCLDLLREIHQPDLDFDRLRMLVENDVSLSYQLLRYANSALLGSRTETTTIDNALIRLGEEGIRHWAVLATLPILAHDKPGELITLSLVRAHFCDRLARLAHLRLEHQAYLMGLFSLLNALIDMPLAESLERANLPARICAALLETAPDHDPLLTLRKLSLAYESGDWDGVAHWAATLNVPPEAVGNAYLESAQWAQGILHPRAGDRIPAQSSAFDTSGPGMV